MESAPKSKRTHIGLFGRRNAGKSSLLNALAAQDVAIVSDAPGTTTDNVEKPMEMLPLGPVIFIDTAGLDDRGALGAARMAKTRRAFDRADLGIIVTDGTWGATEDEIYASLHTREVPQICVITKSDIARPDADFIAFLKSKGMNALAVSSVTMDGVDDLRAAIANAAPTSPMDSAPLLSDLVGPGQFAIFVTPIDKEAPKGRLIAPQVQAIRDLLDADAMSLIVKERELRAAIDQLKSPPRLVVTDSQVFLKVAGDVPASIPLTSFSILFARAKGDLIAQAQGAAAIDHLRPGDKILIAEACTHRPMCEDIGRIKIPRWIAHLKGGAVPFDMAAGYDFPDDLSPYRLVVHCGGCMFNRAQMAARMRRCQEAGVPITNYGLAIAHSLGIMPRALEPFPAALDAYLKAQKA